MRLKLLSLLAIRCERAPAVVARALQLGRADTVLVMERQSFATGHDGGHTPCEFMRIHIVPERYEFRLQVSGPLEIARSVSRVTAAAVDHD
jgi:GntR family transcriptional regulator